MNEVLISTSMKERKVKLSRVALITVTHDPNGKNISLLKKQKKEIEKLYDELYSAVSDQTSAQLKSELENSKFNVKTIPKKGAAYARRESVNFGLSGKADFFHYCDFDRLLTWMSKHPNELKEIVKEVADYSYIILGRTERAFYTHPIEWIETEKITNKIFSLEFGQDVDITAGSCSFSRVSAEYINKYSKDSMTDAEWPMIIHRIAKSKVGWKAVNGLEYHDEVNGYNSIKNETDEWFGRLRLSYIISESAIKTGRE